VYYKNERYINTLIFYLLPFTSQTIFSLRVPEIADLNPRPPFRRSVFTAVICDRVRFMVRVKWNSADMAVGPFSVTQPNSTQHRTAT